MNKTHSQKNLIIQHVRLITIFPVHKYNTQKLKNNKV